jgi:hypothetical protein
MIRPYNILCKRDSKNPSKTVFKTKILWLKNLPKMAQNLKVFRKKQDKEWVSTPNAQQQVVMLPVSVIGVKVNNIQVSMY